MVMARTTERYCSKCLLSAMLVLVLYVHVGESRPRDQCRHAQHLKYLHVEINDGENGVDELAMKRIGRQGGLSPSITSHKTMFRGSPVMRSPMSRLSEHNTAASTGKYEVICGSATLSFLRTWQYSERNPLILSCIRPIIGYKAIAYTTLAR